MSDVDEFHSSLIRALGGKAKLARALGLEDDVLTKWHVRGIPSRYWHEVIEIAASLDEPIAVTAADLARTKPVTRAAA